MSITHTLIRTYKDTSSNTIQQTEAISADTERNFDNPIPIAANTEVNMTFTHSALQTFMITSDQAITLYTNAPSTGSPQDTITLIAGQVNMWSLATDGLGKCPFSADVTSLYFTNTSSAAANVKIRSLLVEI